MDELSRPGRTPGALPSSRTPPRRTGLTWRGRPRRLVRRCRLLQLLPRQEPRRLRRRGRCRDRRRRSRRPDPLLANHGRPTGHVAYSLRRRAKQSPRRAAGCRPLRQAARGWTLERGPTRKQSRRIPSLLSRERSNPRSRSSQGTQRPSPARRAGRAARPCRTDALRASGIQSGIHYPIPCHLQDGVSGIRDEPASGRRTGGGRDPVTSSLPAHHRASRSSTSASA